MATPANNQEASEARGKQRHTLNQTIQVFDTFSSQELGSLVNISREGMMLVSARPLEPNRIYQIELALPGDTTESVALVIDCLWTKEACSDALYWAGCSIIDSDDQSSAAIEKLINQYCEAL